MTTSLDDLRRTFIDSLARSIYEGVAHIPDSEITDAIRDVAMSSQDLVEALDEAS